VAILLIHSVASELPLAAIPGSRAGNFHARRSLSIKERVIHGMIDGPRAEVRCSGWLRQPQYS